MKDCSNLKTHENPSKKLSSFKHPEKFSFAQLHKKFNPAAHAQCVALQLGREIYFTLTCRVIQSSFHRIPAALSDVATLSSIKITSSQFYFAFCLLSRALQPVWRSLDKRHSRESLRKSPTHDLATLMTTTILFYGISASAKISWDWEFENKKSELAEKFHTFFCKNSFIFHVVQWLNCLVFFQRSQVFSVFYLHLNLVENLNWDISRDALASNWL